MRLPDALEPARLSQLSADGTVMSCGGSTRRPARSRSSRLLQRVLVDPVETSVQVPNGTWTLSVEPVRGWGNPVGVTLEATVGLIIAFLSAQLANLLQAQRARRSELELLVGQRTADIKTAKDQLKSLLDAIPDPVWLKDADGVFLSCNPQVERYFNTAEPDIVGRTDYDLLDPRLADTFRDNDRKAMEADRPRANEEWLTFARDGYRGLFETIKTPIHGPDGKVTGVLGIARDITARYRAERAAKLSKTRLSIALQATQIAIWDWDIRRDRWYASRELLHGLGYEPEPRLGDREVWLERVHPDDRARVRRIIEAAISGAPHLYEYEAALAIIRRRYRWMSVRGKTVQRDRKGSAVRMLGVRMDITDRKHAEERIRRLAHYDTLTGLPNRTLLNERMSKDIALAESERQPMAVLILDIDKFKNINDTFGQMIGDALLVEVGKRLQSLAREGDTVARVSGDTFVMVLLGAKTTRTTRMAQRVLDVLSTPFSIRELELVVTPTIGVAMYPAHGTDFDTLIKSADTAMHRAKHGGRNQYVFFTEEMQARAARNQVLESALRHAVERNELQLHYQPQISLSDNRITGAEALLRWHNPDLGHVSPAEFIPIIEDSGQIVEIGTWVLRTAATQLHDWLSTGVTAFSLAVNISSAQFRHPNLPGLIGKILDETGLDPGTLELELTEGVAMDDPLAAIAIMNELHDLGVRISIDDFGTGYSSLSYLKRFRVHKLKIDQTFVRDVADDADDQAIVKAIINLANSLGIDTIAEGVETLPNSPSCAATGAGKPRGSSSASPFRWTSSRPF